MLKGHEPGVERIWRGMSCDIHVQVDDDDSGVITYDELVVVTRRKMEITKRDISDQTLKALWCMLDDDNNDHIDSVEFVRAA